MASLSENPNKQPPGEVSSVKSPSSKGDAVEETTATNDEKEPRDLRSKKHKTAEKIQFSALCWCIFLIGWNDGTTGPLLPRIQEVYHVFTTP